jgi:hypothetical protein
VLQKPGQCKVANEGRVVLTADGAHPTGNVYDGKRRKKYCKEAKRLNAIDHPSFGMIVVVRLLSMERTASPSDCCIVVKATWCIKGL